MSEPTIKEELQLILDSNKCSPQYLVNKEMMDRILQKVRSLEGELAELKKGMGSDQTLAESLYEYHMRAEKAEGELAKEQERSKELARQSERTLIILTAAEEKIKELTHEADYWKGEAIKSGERVKAVRDWIKTASAPVKDKRAYYRCPICHTSWWGDDGLGGQENHYNDCWVKLID